MNDYFNLIWAGFGAIGSLTMAIDTKSEKHRLAGSLLIFLGFFGYACMLVISHKDWERLGWIIAVSIIYPLVATFWLKKKQKRTISAKQH